MERSKVASSDEEKEIVKHEVTGEMKATARVVHSREFSKKSLRSRLLFILFGKKATNRFELSWR